VQARVRITQRLQEAVDALGPNPRPAVRGKNRRAVHAILAKALPAYETGDAAPDTAATALLEELRPFLK
jgi:hypothetical protein